MMLVIAVAMVVATEAFVPRTFMHRGQAMKLSMNDEFRHEKIVNNVGKALTSGLLAAGLFISPVFADVGLKSTMILSATASKDATPAPAPAPKAYVIERDAALLDKVAAVKKTTLPVTKPTPTVTSAISPSKPSPAPVASKKAPSASTVRLLPEEVNSHTASSHYYILSY